MRDFLKKQVRGIEPPEVAHRCVILSIMCCLLCCICCIIKAAVVVQHGFVRILTVLRKSVLIDLLHSLRPRPSAALRCYTVRDAVGVHI